MKFHLTWPMSSTWKLQDSYDMNTQYHTIPMDSYLSRCLVPFQQRIPSRVKLRSTLIADFLTEPHKLPDQ